MSHIMTEQVNADTSDSAVTEQLYTTSSSMLTTGQWTVDNSVSLDYMNGLEVCKWILVAAVIPVCIVGLAGNTVSVWAWNANRKHNSVVLLFQCLGLVDNAFLLVTVVRSCLYYADQLLQEKEVIIIPVLLLFHSWSVHVTMVIGISRWLAVARPVWMQRIRRRQIVMVCGGLGIWCGLLSGLTHMNKEVHLEEAEEEYMTMTLVILVVQFILPNLVLMGFSISLLRFNCQRHRLGRSKVSHRGRTTMTVLGIAGCSLLSCVIVESSKLVAMMPHEVSTCTYTCALTLYAVGILASVLNSSVNVFLYFFIASKFRAFLRQTVNRHSTRRRGSQPKSSISSSFSESSMRSANMNTHAGGLCQQGMNEEPTNRPADGPTEETICL
ncbi:C5a anaphylatoxin chemotactic receptor 1-like [Babylonia areolata]|uniref:C5a anaphylatoxin chemotactic receptor 1-like n=1 Tax=Babylonia areolata TaxID=304850 RepID=UPI003FD1E060